MRALPTRVVLTCRPARPAPCRTWRGPAVQARLADFVKQNIDNMLATRHMKHATNAMEGQLHNLTAANDQLVTHMAGHAVQVRVRV